MAEPQLVWWLRRIPFGRREFADNVLPYIKNVGYNAVQLMALQVNNIWSLVWVLADPRFL
jgi:hypothetical protein